MCRRPLYPQDCSRVAGYMAEPNGAKGEILALPKPEPPFSRAGHCVARKQISKWSSAVDITMHVRHDDACCRSVLSELLLQTHHPEARERLDDFFSEFTGRLDESFRTLTAGQGTECSHRKSRAESPGDFCRALDG